VLALTIGYGVVVSGSLIGFAIAGILLTAVVTVHPYAGAFLSVVLAFTVGWLIDASVLPSGAAVVQDLTMIGLVLAVLARVARGTRARASYKGLRWALAFLAAAALGLAVNTAWSSTALLSLRSIVTYLPLFFLPSALRWGKRRRLALVRFLLAMTLLQVPVAMTQYFLRSFTRSGDEVSGTVGAFGSGSLTVLMIGMGCLVIGMMLYRAAPMAVLIAVYVAMCIPPALNETKAFFFAAPVIWAIVVVPRIGKRFGLALVVGLVAASAFFLVYQAYLANYGTGLQRAGGLSEAVRTQLGTDLGEGGVIKRWPSVVYTARAYRNDLSIVPFGFGAGTLSNSEWFGSAGRVVTQQPELRSLVFNVRLALEYGLLGVAGFFGLIAVAFLEARKVERLPTVASWKATAVGVQGFAVTMALMGFYTSTFSTPALACSFWLLAGLCVQVESTAMEVSL
jgi:hypothetical protein